VATDEGGSVGAYGDCLVFMKEVIAFFYSKKVSQ
jgi:hypothetical protein